MAKIKFSGIGITNIVGKLGGTVFARNRGGNYVKNYVKPANPRTAAQQLVRTWFGTISALWRSLTVDQRIAWNQAGENYPVLNPFGDTLILSGKALCQRLNTTLLNAGYTVINAPLQPTGALAPVELDSSTGTVALGAITALAFEANFTDNVTGRVVIDATRAMNRNRAPQNSDFRRLQVEAVSNNPSVPADIEAAYVNVFGSAAQVGSVIHVRAALVVPTGEISTHFVFPITLTA